MQRRNESRTEMCCLEADSGLFESAEASPPRFSVPSQLLAQTAAFFDLKTELVINLPVMPFEKLKAESHS